MRNNVNRHYQILCLLCMQEMFIVFFYFLYNQKINLREKLFEMNIKNTLNTFVK